MAPQAPRRKKEANAAPKAPRSGAKRRGAEGATEQREALHLSYTRHFWNGPCHARGGLGTWRRRRRGAARSAAAPKAPTKGRGGEAPKAPMKGRGREAPKAPMKGEGGVDPAFSRVGPTRDISFNKVVNF